MNNEHIILELLRGTGAKCGAEITHLTPIGRGSVYNTLKRLQRKGLVESVQEVRRPGCIGPPRRFFFAKERT